MSLKNIVIGIAILILTISVVVYGIATVYERPNNSDFCEGFNSGEIINDSAYCKEIGGKWVAREDDGLKPVTPVEVGWCDRDFQCRQDYENAMKKYSRNLFLITLPLGILIIILGGVVFGLEDVGAGLMGGGVGVILYGVGNYWRYSGDLLRFSLSLVGLIVIIWFAYWFNKGKK